MKQLIKKAVFILSALMIAVMCCCTGDDKGRETKQTKENAQEALYHTENLSLTGAAEYDPTDILLSDLKERCFFFSQKENVYSFYCMDFETGSNPERLLDFQADTVFSWNVSSIDEGSEILSFFAYLENQAHFYVFDTKGEMKKDILLKDPEAYQVYAFMHWILPGGRYLAAGRQELLLFDDQGESIKQIECPGNSFQGGFLTKAGELYVSYADQSKKNQLAKVDIQNGRLEHDFQIPGAGTVFCEDGDGRLYTADADNIYCLDINKQHADQILAFAGFQGIAGNRLKCMQSAGDNFRLLFWDPLNAGRYLDLVTFLPGAGEQKVQAPEEKTDASGRRIITLYAPDDLVKYLIGSQIINGFNSDNKEYVIKIDNSQVGVNTRLADVDSPDLMLLVTDTEIESYYEKGYLENLLPYFRESQDVPEAELAETLINAYGYDGGLYSVCKGNYVVSLYGLESQMGSKEGWTTDEFLQWIETNPKIFTIEELGKRGILDFCLMGNMSSYVTADGRACFGGEKFRNLLERIGNLDFTASPSNRPLYDKMMEPDQKMLAYVFMPDVAYLAQTEALYGEKLIKKGFPNDEGIPVSTLFSFGNLCILKKSSCKEGAFAFLEYMLTDPWYNMEHFTGNSSRYEPKGTLYTVKKLLNRDMELAIGEHKGRYLQPDNTYLEKEYNITEEQEARVLEALSKAQPNTYINWEIRMIVGEEAEAYFAGQKDLEETCRVIQNRVQLFLNERR